MLRVKVQREERAWHFEGVALNEYCWQVTCDGEGSREMSQKANHRDFPGGPVAKTPRSQCRGPGFDPWSGN